MKYTYSPSAGAFFPNEFKESYKAAGSWPTDGIEVTKEIRDKFLAQPPEGKCLGADQNGHPAWIDIPEPDKEEQQAEFINERNLRILFANDYIASKQWPARAVLGRLKGNELSDYNKWLDHLEELESITLDTVRNNHWPQPPLPST
nr:MAG TPA: tail fiber assembly protein [Caudoviricetes sp.]